jgi:hypothetical protein
MRSCHDCGTNCDSTGCVRVACRHTRRRVAFVGPTDVHTRARRGLGRAYVEQLTAECDTEAEHIMKRVHSRKGKQPKAKKAQKAVSAHGSTKK